MATLSGNKIKDTYQSLVKFSDNGNITVGAKQLTDGFGNNSPIFVSTTQVGIGVTPESGLNLHVYGDAKIGSNLTVIGNLVVEGSTTTVGTDTLTVKDPLIVLANNNTSTDAVDIGFYGKYTPSGTTLYSGLFREALTGKYRLFKDLQVEPTTTVNTSGTGYAQATLIAALEGNVTGNLTGNVTGGTISGTTGDFSGDITADAFYLNGMTAGSGALYWTSDRVTLANYNSSGILRFETGGGTNALTLDDSQNATFAGGVTASSFSGNLTGNVTGNLTGNVTGNVTGDVTGDLTGNVTGDITGNVTATSVLADGVTATTQSSGDNSTKVATTAYVDSLQISSTLSEILANGNTSGSNDIIMADDQKINFGDDSDLQIYHDGTDGYVQNGTGNLIIEQTTDDADIIFKNDNGSGDTVEYFRVDGSESRVVYGRSIQMADNVSVYFGNSVDDDGYIKWDSTADELFINGDTKFLEDARVVGNLVVGEHIGNRAFSVKGTSTANLPFVSLVNTATSSHNGLLVTCDNTPVDYIADFRLGSTSKFKIKANGNVTSTGSIQAVSLYGDLTSSSSSSGDYVRVYGGSGTGKWDIYGDGANLRISDNESAGILAVDTGATFGGNATFDGNVEINDTISNNFTTNYDTKLLVGGEIIARSLTANESMISIGGDSTSAFIKSGKQDGSQTARPFRIEVGTSEAMRIDSSGNVGIGTTSPSVKLHVNGGDLRVRDSGNVALQIISSDSGQSAIQFGDDGDTNDGRIVYMNATDLMRFFTNDSEKMVINSSGNVGIGNTNPQSKLQVTTTGYDTGTTGFRLTHAEETNYVGYARLQTPSGDPIFSLGTIDGATTYETLSMKNGNVGIGTNSPENKLHILTSTTDTSSQLMVQNGSTGDAAIKFNISGQSYVIGIDNSDSNKFKIAGSSALGTTDRLVIDSSGRVGINTTNPQFKLDIFDNVSPVLLQIKSTSSSGAGFYIDNDRTGSKKFGFLVGNVAAGAFNIKDEDAGVNRFVIDTNGNVGIGTTSPSRELDVENSADNAVISAVSSTTHIAGLVLGDTADDDKGGILYNNTSDYLYFLSNGSEKMRLTSGGDLHVDGDVVAYSTTISDKRLKDNIKPLESSLEKVMNLKGVEYVWNNGSRKGQKDIGFIAQEVEEVIPEIVREKQVIFNEEEKYKTVDYEKITAVLVEAIKELTAKVERLENNKCNCK
jgi:cytoskeletal protein CcmA (bactofilin family)